MVGVARLFVQLSGLVRKGYLPMAPNVCPHCLTVTDENNVALATERLFMNWLGKLSNIFQH